MAVTTPVWSTVAIAAFDVLQVTARFVALLGLTVAVRVVVPPTFSPAVDGATATDVTGIVAADTVIVELSALPEPS